MTDLSPGRPEGEPGEPRVARAVIVSTDAGATDRLEGLIKGLQAQGIRVDQTDSVTDTAALALDAEDSPVCLLVDSRARFGEIIGALKDALPGCTPVVVFPSPPAHLAIDAFRAGAGDVLDCDVAGSAELDRVLARIEERFAAHTERRRQLSELRTALDDFLKAVVQAERRSIDLENQLAAHKSESPRMRRITDEVQARRPVVLIVEEDRELGDLLVERLEDMGVVTFAFVTSEEAVQHSKLLAENAEPIDFAVLDVSLSGTDGLRTLQLLRAHRAELPALMLASSTGSETALQAASLGVIDLVRKPFEDTAAVLDRIRELAIEAMHAGRERVYLERIKRRHEGVLNRYRELRAVLEEMEV